MSKLLKQIPEKRQILTYALRGALEILQMPKLELTNFLLEQIEKNPLLQPHESHSFRIEKEIPAQTSFYEHLFCQIRETFLDKNNRQIAYALMEHLDEKGYLCSSYKMLEEAKIDRILPILQSLEPPGIFARNLQESLLLQLKAKGKKHLLAYRLIELCFDDLLHQRYSQIKKKLGESNLTCAIQDLARLSFHPSGSFKNDFPSFIHIDLCISKKDQGWSLKLIEEDLPQFHIADEYLQLENLSLEEKLSLREWKVQANWLIRSLKRRRKLLLQIGKILICKQFRFLNGEAELVSLSMKELCDELNVHESTLSRALSGKYVATPRGVLPLKSLITKTPKALSAKQELESLIHSEDKKEPLTDEALAQLLKEKGFCFSRRTIAKYRTQLKIGCANQRKYS